MIELKIGRNTYEITEKDQFLDNKSCVQLMTQSKERLDWGQRGTPVLSQRAIKEISGFERVQHKHSYNINCELLSLKDA